MIKRALGFAQERAAGFTDWWDGIIEDAVRKPVTPIWEEMKRDARLPFDRFPYTKTNANGGTSLVDHLDNVAAVLV